VLKGLLRDHLDVDAARLDTAVFPPESATARSLAGLVA
jgi:uncharacterized protein (DUF1501 family)